MQNKCKLVIPVNETGHVIGERHHRAKLSDRQVALMLELHEEWGFSYRKLAWVFGVTRAQVRNICTYRQRSCTVMGHKTVYITA